MIGGLKSYWKVSVGLEPRDSYMKREAYGSYSCAEFAAKNLPKGSKFFFYALDTGLYYENDYFWGDKLHAGSFMRYSSMRSYLDMLSRLRELGATHMVVSSGYWPPRKGYNEENIHTWVKEISLSCSRKLFEDKYISLYELDYGCLSKGIKKEGPYEKR
jgi:hypothetical protein